MRLAVRCFIAFVATFALWFGPKILRSPYEDVADFFEIDLTGAVVFGCIYAATLPVQLWRAGEFARRSMLVHPIVAALLGWLLVLAPRWIFIPVLTPLSYAVGRAWPMGHFGFTAWFIGVAYTAVLAVLVMTAAGWLFRAFRRRWSIAASS